MKVLRIFLLILGLGLFAYLIHQAGPAEIAQQLARLGVWLPILIIPYAISYSLDTLGWRVTLGKHEKTLGFVRLFLTRLGGEAINLLTPTAYLGGEPVKAYLLQKAEVPLPDGLASVVIAKTTMTLAQLIFILAAIILAYRQLAGTQGLLVSTLVVTFFGIVIIVAAWWIQKRGLFGFLTRLLAWIHVPTQFLKKREAELNAVDHTIRQFCSEHKRKLVLSVLYFLLGWIAGAFEVYLLLLLLGIPIGVGEAIAIEAFVSLVRVVLFFLPAGIGAQEGGNVFLFYLFGLPREAAMTYSILRRLRELILIAVGLSVLAKYELKPKVLQDTEVPITIPREIEP